MAVETWPSGANPVQDGADGLGKTVRTELTGPVTANPPSAATRAANTAYAASKVLKASAGTLLAVFGYNSKSSDQFIQLHDAASLPANTAVPVAVIVARANDNFYIEVPIGGIPFSTGIVVCNSSTGPTLTVGSADCYFTGVVL